MFSSDGHNTRHFPICGGGGRVTASATTAADGVVAVAVAAALTGAWAAPRPPSHYLIPSPDFILPL